MNLDINKLDGDMTLKQLYDVVRAMDHRLVITIEKSPETTQTVPKPSTLSVAPEDAPKQKELKKVIDNYTIKVNPDPSPYKGLENFRVNEQGLSD